MARPSVQQQQDHLVEAMTPAIVAAWALLDKARLAQTFPTFSAAVASLVQQYGRASATLAARHYGQARTTAGVPGRLTVKQADPAGLEQVSKELRAATDGLWSVDVRDAARRPAARLVTTDNPADSGARLIESALTNVRGVAEKSVLDAGRNTILDAVAADRKARGWARLPEAGACSFCLLLATRGAVYKSGSFTESNARFTGDGAFKVHDHCRCGVEPLFAAHYEPTAQVRLAQALYKSSTAGLSGKAARNAFRRAVDAERP